MIVERAGGDVEADILLWDRSPPQTDVDVAGFLNYSSAGAKLNALSRLPPAGCKSRCIGTWDGQSETARSIFSVGELRQ
jgi:hypothetical protein